MGRHHARPSDTSLRFAFLINLAFALVEIFGGIWTNSVAILSDAVHDLGDALALGTAWGLERYSRKGGDRTFSYGYVRFSLLGALVNTTVLVLGSALVLTEAIPRLSQPQDPNSIGMLLFSVIGIVANGLAALRLRHGDSLNNRVAAWHLIEDVLGWIAVLIASVLLIFFDVPLIDPLLSVAITAFVLFNVFRHLRKTLMLFLQAVPEEIDLRELESQLMEVDHVLSLHHTHVWSMDGLSLIHI